MICPATVPDVERFRAVITWRMGLRFEDAKLGFLGEVLRGRLKMLRRDGGGYLCELEYDPPPGEMAALARELTVGETYFFRESANNSTRSPRSCCPNAFGAQRMPELLRLLSAGCSSGEEAYSMAIVARETIADPSWTFAIRAVDLNPLALEKAARARYSSWALRETPTEARAKWFHADGHDMVLDDDVRSAVTFEADNLASDDAQIWQPEVV